MGRSLPIVIPTRHIRYTPHITCHLLGCSTLYANEGFVPTLGSKRVSESFSLEWKIQYGSHFELLLKFCPDYSSGIKRDRDVGFSDTFKMTAIKS